MNVTLEDRDMYCSICDETYTVRAMVALHARNLEVVQGECAVCGDMLVDFNDDENLI